MLAVFTFTNKTKMSLNLEKNLVYAFVFTAVYWGI